MESGASLTKEEQLHKYARQLVSELQSTSNPLVDLDKKQLRFNDIVQTSLEFYNDPFQGVKELIESCDRYSPLYINKQPMWDTLNKEYEWMLK